MALDEMDTVMKDRNMTGRTIINRARTVIPRAIRRMLGNARRICGAPVFGAVLALLLPVWATDAQDNPPTNDALPGMNSEVSVSDTGRVDLHVADLPLSKVLRLPTSTM